MINKAKIIPILFTAAIASSLTACYCEDCGESCSEVHDIEYKLAECQKTVGNFKKESTIHYVHAKGSELDLKVTKDSIYKQRDVDFCANIETEVREIELTSTYPITGIKVRFSGGDSLAINDDSTDFISSINIHYASSNYVVDLNSAGTPIKLDYKDNIKMHDTITFNGVKYDSVFVIYDHLYYTDKESSQKEEHPKLYFSKEKGILRIESNDGQSLTIKEGDENE